MENSQTEVEQDDQERRVAAQLLQMAADLIEQGLKGAAIMHAKQAIGLMEGSW